MSANGDQNQLPENLSDYAFGVASRSGIAILGNDAGGFSALTRALDYSEIYSTLEACLNEETDYPSSQPRNQRESDIRRLWAQLDDPATTQDIVSRHRQLYYAWRHDIKHDPLSVCVINGDIDKIDALVADGASLNSRAGALSPLHLAADDASEPMTNALLERGAQVDATDSLDRSPLMLATARGADAVVSKLLAAGANPLLANRDGGTALIIAAEGGYRSCALMLLPESDCEHHDSAGRSASAAALAEWPALASEIDAYAFSLKERDALTDASPPRAPIERNHRAI